MCLYVFIFFHLYICIFFIYECIFFLRKLSKNIFCNPEFEWTSCKIDLLEFDSDVHHDKTNKSVKRSLSVGGHRLYEAAGANKYSPETNGGVGEDRSGPIEEKTP